MIYYYNIRCPKNESHPSLTANNFDLLGISVLNFQKNLACFILDCEILSACLLFDC